MPTIQREITIRCSPDDFLGFVMDIERYAEVDDKLGSFDWVRREQDFVEFRFRPILPGIPARAPHMTARGRLTPHERIDVSLAPLPLNRVFHRIMTFAASFAVEPADGGTLVRRTFSVEPRPALRWLLDPILRRSLPADIESELRQAKHCLEQRARGKTLVRDGDR
jgi:polyketide cyclase/dehydrase/lipid transport protein